jgi:hypothetical protein
MAQARLRAEGDWVEIESVVSPEEDRLTAKYSGVRRLLHNGNAFFAVPYGILPNSHFNEMIFRVKGLTLYDNKIVNDNWSFIYRYEDCTARHDDPIVIPKIKRRISALMHVIEE